MANTELRGWWIETTTVCWSRVRSFRAWTTCTYEEMGAGDRAQDGQHRQGSARTKTCGEQPLLLGSWNGVAPLDMATRPGLQTLPSSIHSCRPAGFPPS